MYSIVFIHRIGEFSKVEKAFRRIDELKGDRQVQVISVPDTSGTGKLGALRNKGIDQTAGDIIINFDADILIEKDFFPGIEEFSHWEHDWQVCSCRVLNPDGTRHWDYKANNGRDKMLHYMTRSNDVVLTGGIVIAKKEVYQKVRWSNELGFYEQEDIDFSNRLKEAGIEIDFNPYSTVTHNDPRYQRVRGLGVIRNG